MYRYILIFLLALPIVAASQSMRNSNFTWVAQQAQNLASDTIQEQHVVFKSYGTSTWTDISQEGAMRFSVQTDNHRAAITVGRSSEGPYLILDMTPSRPDRINFKYFHFIAHCS